uniref:Ras-related protein Rab-33 n=1 Tax=Ditylenchus dipsaci TaxID=166011 RepID=A0A915CTG9_9BILA
MNPVASTVDFCPQPQEQANKAGDEPHILKPKFVPYPSPGSSLGQGQLEPLKPTPSSIGNSFAPKTAYKSKRVFKVIIIGDAGVGKTCLSFRFCNGRFPAQTEATIGVDFRERSLAIDNELIRIQLWDTAGQERYRQSIVAHYYRNVNAVVFVYDVTNPSSFKSLKTWISECNKHAVTSSDDTPHILIGNKCDLAQTNRVGTSEAQIFADENDMALFETSALADSEADHVESIFMTLVHKLRHSKAMHVQTAEERSEKGQKLLLKANEADNLETEEGWCC